MLHELRDDLEAVRAWVGRKQAQIAGVQLQAAVADWAVGQFEEFAPADVAFPAQPPGGVFAVVGAVGERDVVPVVA